MPANGQHSAVRGSVNSLLTWSEKASDARSMGGNDGGGASTAALEVAEEGTTGVLFLLVVVVVVAPFLASAVTGWGRPEAGPVEERVAPIRAAIMGK